MQFTEKWSGAVDKTGNTIIAGLDPARFGMRDKMTLQEKVSFRDWCLDYVEAVAPHVAGIKCNAGYFQDPEGMKVLQEIAFLAKEKGLVTIIDAKISDIGSTNDAWLFNQTDWDATTIAPYAGNIEDTVKMGKARGLGVIGMGYMSNPEYEHEARFVDLDTGKKLYEDRIEKLLANNADAIVVGATLKGDNPNLIRTLQMAKGKTFLLVPGIGAQGGTVNGFLDNAIVNGIDPKTAMLNVGRDMMFPNGLSSTGQDQADAAMRFAKLSADRIK
jgi:orotidine 5'-phosphate decarboxylase subfamily 2